MKSLKQVTWWICFLAFWLHQFCERILQWHWTWADSYLDSLLCMPILLGLLLFERRFWLKDKNYCFPLLDTVIMVLLLSLLYEEGFTRMFDGFVRDTWDYLCYFVGGGMFFLIQKK